MSPLDWLAQFINWLAQNPDSVAQLMMAVGTLVLAYFAYKQIKYLSWEHSRKIALDAAVSASCILSVIKEYYQFYRPKLAGISDKTCCAPLRGSRIFNDLRDCLEYYDDRLASAIYALKDKKAEKLLPHLTLTAKLIAAVENLNEPEEDVPEHIEEVYIELAELIDYLTKKYKISIGEMEEESRRLGS